MKENIITKACRELGVNQTELGKMFDVPQSTIARWKKGEIPKMAELAIQYMLENIELQKKLNTIKQAQSVLQEL
jgi:predicted transcriptional regulator